MRVFNGWTLTADPFLLLSRPVLLAARMSYTSLSLCFPDGKHVALIRMMAAPIRSSPFFDYALCAFGFSDLIFSRKRRQGHGSSRDRRAHLEWMPAPLFPSSSLWHLLFPRGHSSPPIVDPREDD